MKLMNGDGFTSWLLDRVVVVVVVVVVGRGRLVLKIFVIACFAVVVGCGLWSWSLGYELSARAPFIRPDIIIISPEAFHSPALLLWPLAVAIISGIGSNQRVPCVTFNKHHFF
jgi:hypothetical protein